MDWRYQLLKRTGYSFYREKETAGKTLEFLGTSGVGKTTLFRGCLPKLRNRWFSSYHMDFLKRTVRSCEPDAILMKLLEKNVEKVFSPDLSCPWHSLLDLRLSVKVMHEAMVVAQNVHPMGFAFDDGLFRHFCAELLELGDDIPVELWKNRAFVYLQARSADTALYRLKARRKKKARIQSHRDETEDQFFSRITRDQQMFESIVDKALTFGCPVLVLEAEDPIRDSIEKVLNFEKSLMQRFNIQKNMDLNSTLISENQ